MRRTLIVRCLCLCSLCRARVVRRARVRAGAAAAAAAAGHAEPASAAAVPAAAAAVSASAGAVSASAGAVSAASAGIRTAASAGYGSSLRRGTGSSLRPATTRSSSSRQYYPQQPQQPRPAPPPVDYVEPEPPAHAPKFSLWVGPRLSYMGFGFSFYRNANGASETTGQLVGNGVAPEIDLGVRFAHRYAAFLFYEHGFLLAGPSLRRRAVGLGLDGLLRRRLPLPER